MGREIEHKYLVAGDAWRAAVTRTIHIRQGYLQAHPDRTVRVRITDEKAYLTIKGRSVGAARAEFEYPIPRDDAEAIYATLCDRRLEKRRHHVVVAGKTWEVDEFVTPHAGLVLAEIELQREDEPYERPPWLGADVTHDPRYANSALAQPS